MRLDVFLLYIFAFIIKKSMRISRPSYTSHIHFKLRLWLWWRLNNNILGFGKFLHQMVMLLLDLNQLIWINSILLLIWDLLVQETAVFERWFVWRHVPVLQMLIWRIISWQSVFLIRLPSCLWFADHACLPLWAASFRNHLNYLLNSILCSRTVYFRLDYFLNLLFDRLLWSFRSPSSRIS